MAGGREKTKTENGRGPGGPRPMAREDVCDNKLRRVAADPAYSLGGFMFAVPPEGVELGVSKAYYKALGGLRHPVYCACAG